MNLGPSLFLIVLILSGCASVHPPRAKRETARPGLALAGPSETPGPSEALVSGQTGVEESQVTVPLGSVFGKTSFGGVVKTSYVQLSIVDQSDPEKTYELYIGDKARQKNFPWKVQTVSPGYFFIDLPVGRYRIAAITIPVATSLATEPMDISFEVLEGKSVYLGTLAVQGISERIRFGGVPIIRPGFEYSVRVVDEEREASQEYRVRFPDHPEDLVWNLMKVRADTNAESEPED